MNDSRKLYRAFTFVTFGLTAITVAVRTAILCFTFDHALGYHAGGIFSTLLYILIALGFLSAVAYVAVAGKATKQQLRGFAPTPGSASIPTYVCSLAVAASFVIALTWEILTGDWMTSSFLAKCIGALLAILYFSLPKKENVRLLGMGPHLYLVLALISEYFDWSVPMNSPIKLMNQAATVCVLLMLCDELLSLGGKARPLYSTVCVSIAILLGLTSGIPVLVSAAVNGAVETEYLIHTIPSLTLGLYAAARLLHSCEIEIIPHKKHQKQDIPVSENSDTTNNEEN